MTQHVRVTTADRVTTIRLDRPDKKNAITLEMYAALSDALQSSTRDPRTDLVSRSWRGHA